MFRQEMQIHSVVVLVVVVRIVLTSVVRFAVTMMLVFALNLPWMILPHVVTRPTVLLLALWNRGSVNRILLLVRLSLLASTIVLMRLLLLMMMLLLPATIDTRTFFMSFRCVSN